MSLNINNVVLGGNLTRDPEVKQLPGGKTVAKLGIAINDRYKAADGSWKESVTFVDCEAWGATAEFAGKYLRRGNGVVLEGRLKSDEWQTQNGEKRQKLLMKIERLHSPSAAGQRNDDAPARPVAMPVRSPEAGFIEDEPPF